MTEKKKDNWFEWERIQGVLPENFLEYLSNENRVEAFCENINKYMHEIIKVTDNDSTVEESLMVLLTTHLLCYENNYDGMKEDETSKIELASYKLRTLYSIRNFQDFIFMGDLIDATVEDDNEISPDKNKLLH